MEMILYTLISIAIALIARVYFAKTIKTFGLPAKYEQLNKFTETFGADATANVIAIVVLIAWPAIILYIVYHWIKILIKER